MRFKQTFNNRKAHAHSVFLRGASDLTDLRKLLVGKRFAVVSNARVCIGFISPDLEFHTWQLYISHSRHRVLQKIGEYQLELNRIGLHIGSQSEVRVNQMPVLAVALLDMARSHRQIRMHECSFFIGGIAADQINYFGGL